MKNKKILIGLSVIAALSLFTSGCGKEIEVKNGSKVAVSTKQNKFTATEYYEKIKEDNISHLVDMIDHSILDKKYKTTKDETESIDKQINQIKSYYGEDPTQYTSVIKQYFGVDSEEELRDKLSLEYKRNKAVEDYVTDHITKDEIQKYYDEKTFGQVSAKHILIPVDAKEDASEDEKNEADKKAKEKAEKVIKELDKGKDFGELAKKYSKDESNASNGGDLGYFDLDSMVEEFSNAVKELKVDEYTKEPVKTEYGYHIAQLIEKRGDRVSYRHILIKPKVDEKELEAGLLRLDSIANDVRKGTFTFEEAATYLSQDKETRNNKGLMVNPNTGTARFEMQDLAQVSQEIAVAVEGLNIGEISKPIVMLNKRGKEVCAIVKLKSRIDGHKATMSEDYQRLKAIVQDKLAQEKLEKWIREKQKKTYVRINENWVNCEFKYPGWIKEE